MPEQYRNVSCVVAVGASAGGLDPIRELFEHLPESTGACFVVLQHLSPLFKSQMPELLQRRTNLPVELAEDGAKIQPNTVWLIPPRKALTVREGTLHLHDWDANDPRMHFVIDRFFRSVAADLGARSIAVVLSGTGSDGMVGSREINREGGIVLVQEPDTAQFDGMPRSVIQAGFADRVLSPVGIAYEVATYAEVFRRARRVEQEDVMPALRRVRELFASRGEALGIMPDDVLERRLRRRAHLAGLETIHGFVELVEDTPTEADVLASELHTSNDMFGSHPAFGECLSMNVLPAIIERLRPNEELRCWVSGCKTGELAYSMAMVIFEALESSGARHPVRVFATDSSLDALSIAKAAWYANTSVSQLSMARLERWFVPDDGGYRVGDDLRAVVSFAQSAAAAQAPYPRIQLAVARDSRLQHIKHAYIDTLRMLSRQLVPRGFLCAGDSAWNAEAAEGTTLAYPEQQIFQKHTQIPAPDVPASWRTPDAIVHPNVDEASFAADLHGREAACLYVNAEGVVFRALGAIERFLRVHDGVFNHNLHSMLPVALALPATTAIRRARSEGSIVSHHNVPCSRDEGAERVDLHVTAHPASGTRAGFATVLIERTEPRAPAPVAADLPVRVHVASALEAELSLTRDNMQSIIEELEIANERAHASNEELMASNEELQSANEELQSVNEELHTVNVEHLARVDEMTTLQQTIDAILASAGVGMVLLDGALRIQRFTSGIHVALPLEDSDVGRPIRHLRCGLDVDLLRHLTEVRDSQQASVQLVHTEDGERMWMRLSPYLVAPEEMACVVLTLVSFEGELVDSDVSSMLRAVLGTRTAITVTWNDGFATQPELAVCLGLDEHTVLDTDALVSALGEVVARRLVDAFSREGSSYLADHRTRDGRWIRVAARGRHGVVGELDEEARVEQAWEEALADVRLRRGVALYKASQDQAHG